MAVAGACFKNGIALVLVGNAGSVVARVEAVVAVAQAGVVELRALVCGVVGEVAALDELLVAAIHG